MRGAAKPIFHVIRVVLCTRPFLCLCLCLRVFVRINFRFVFVAPKFILDFLNFTFIFSGIFLCTRSAVSVFECFLSVFSLFPYHELDVEVG